MRLFKTKSKPLLITMAVLYTLLIFALTIPFNAYKVSLPGNLTPISKEIKIADSKSNNEFYSVSVLSYNKVTLFQLLVSNLKNEIDVTLNNNEVSSELSFFRGSLLEELSYQYAIINAYLKAQEEDPNIMIDYSLESFVVTNSNNENINAGERFTHVNNIDIREFTKIELADFLKPLNEATLTVIDLENETLKEVEIFKTDGYFNISVDKYFQINKATPSYETFYERDYSVGPSGGLLQALEIYATLRGIKLNKTISGTGTITPSGEVGAIGGVKQKLYAAKNFKKKVDVFFIPKFNYEEAKDVYDKMKKKSYKLVEVSDFNEAIEELFK